MIAHEACALLSVAPVTVMVPEPAAVATAPVPEGQVVVTFGAAATTTFAGSVSVKLMPDCAGLPAPFVTVNVSVETPFTLIVVGAKALLSEACTNVTVWLVTPFPSTPPTETLPAPLVYAFAAALVTSTVTVQLDAPAAAFTPLPPTMKVPMPAVAVIVGAAPQPFTTFGTAAITSPTGKVSVKVSAVRAGAPAGFAMLKVSVEVCPTPTVAGANALVRSGSAWTVSPELVTLFVTRAVALMFALVLLYGPPTTLEVTSTVITHEACAAARLAPVTVMVADPAAVATAPAPEGQVVVTLGTAATITLAGSVSVKLIPVCAGLPAPLVMVNVSVDVPPWLIVVGAKALLSEA